jgi:arsenical-resistance protein 2
MQSLVLLEGIKGWACAGEEYIALMDEYEAEPWQG